MGTGDANFKHVIAPANEEKVLWKDCLENCCFRARKRENYFWFFEIIIFPPSLFACVRRRGKLFTQVKHINCRERSSIQTNESKLS